MTNEPRDHPHKGLSLSRKTDGGKGDKNHTDDMQAYRDGYDAVDWTDTGEEDSDDTEDVD